MTLDVPPSFDTSAFNCPLCRAYAQQTFHTLRTVSVNQSVSVISSYCSRCCKRSYWLDKKLIYPITRTIAPPPPDLPDEIRAEYEEARVIFDESPRAAAALLRLAVQRLMPVLGEKGENINDDIKSLVSKGLPAMVQQALDICRVVGNNAVHPGEIKLDDSPEIARSLFNMLDLIVENQITQPNKVKEAYEALPERDRDNIEKRDKT